MAVEGIGLGKTYQTRQGEINALEDAAFHIHDREFVCIVGPSGCGKTTVLKLIAGLLRPSAGAIRFDTDPSDGRIHSAMVFQEQGVFPWMTVLQNVAFGLEMQRVPAAERRTRALSFVNRVGFANRYPHELSGGMRQRVAIIRAFLADPQILLMDEPFGALDAQTRLVLQEELLRIWRDERKTVLFVTHDVEEAVLLSDRVLVMSGRPGRILEEIPIPLGRPRDLSARDDPRVTEIKWHIWKMLEDQVRRALAISG